MWRYVFADVGQALRDHEVRRDLDRLRDATLHFEGQVHWHCRPSSERFERDGGAVRAQHRRVRAAGDVAQLGQETATLSLAFANKVLASGSPPDRVSRTPKSSESATRRCSAPGAQVALQPLALPSGRPR